MGVQGRQWWGMFGSGDLEKISRWFPPEAMGLHQVADFPTVRLMGRR